MVDIKFDKTSTTIKTGDITFEGHAVKSSDLCGILGFVDDEGHIHLSSNFNLYSMRPKLTDFNAEIKPSLPAEDTKLNVRKRISLFYKRPNHFVLFIVENRS